MSTIFRDQADIIEERLSILGLPPYDSFLSSNVAATGESIISTNRLCVLVIPLLRLPGVSNSASESLRICGIHASPGSPAFDLLPCLASLTRSSSSSRATSQPSPSLSRRDSMAYLSAWVKSIPLSPQLPKVIPSGVSPSVFGR